MKSEVVILFYIAIAIDILLILNNVEHPSYNLLNSSIDNNGTVSDYKTCKNMSIEGTSICLQDYIRNFYSYNLSNKDRGLSIERLKREGGVCWHYAVLYQQMANELGFKARTITYWNVKSGHEFTLIYNDEGYCILDQQAEIRCNYVG